MTKKDTTTTETKCYCETCRKVCWHDVKHDGVYRYYICQSCGHSVEFSDRGK